MLKRFIALLPLSLQRELRRLVYLRRIRTGQFAASDPDFGFVAQHVRPGDWVLDVGANLGHYTKRLSDTVGANGRVLAFEPFGATFSTLASNVSVFPTRNVTLLNCAASDRMAVFGMSIANFGGGLENHYEARLTGAAGTEQVLAIPVDALHLEHRISFVKIDAEGHDSEVLAGMRELIVRDRPTLLLESVSPGDGEYLGSLGYVREAIPGSPNTGFVHRSPPSV